MFEPLTDPAAQKPMFLRLTPDVLRDRIRNVAFVRGSAAVDHVGQNQHGHEASTDTATRADLKRVTVCFMTLDNGFVAVGHSACIHLENYNAQDGRDAAFAHAFEQCWPLLGFEARSKVVAAEHAPQPAADTPPKLDDRKLRLKHELAEVSTRVGELELFIGSLEYNALDLGEQSDLRTQHRAMVDYCSVLQARIGKLS